MKSLVNISLNVLIHFERDTNVTRELNAARRVYLNTNTSVVRVDMRTHKGTEQTRRISSRSIQLSMLID
jgi:hypothetical protein